MNFIRRIGRDEIYIKYVHQLVNVRLYTQTESQSGTNHAFCRCIFSRRIMSKLL